MEILSFSNNSVFIWSLDEKSRKIPNTILSNPHY